MKGTNKMRERGRRVRLDGEGRLTLPAELRVPPQPLIAASAVGGVLVLMPLEALEHLEHRMPPDLDQSVLTFAHCVRVGTRGRIIVPPLLRRVTLGWAGVSRAGVKCGVHVEEKSVFVHSNASLLAVASNAWRRLFATRTR